LIKPNPSLRVHVAQWKDCRACPLSRRRCRTVLYRGSVPADVLFIGEGPGPSEDVLGKPFVGPAGQLLNQLLDEVQYAVSDTVGVFRSCFTNVVACFPQITVRDIEDGLEKPDAKVGIRDPRKVEAEACRPRLDEFVELVQPKVIIRLGKCAVKYTAHLVGKYPCHELLHPGSLLYMDNESLKRLEYDRCVSRLIRYLEEALCP
jgi:DNA polymerase